MRKNRIRFGDVSRLYERINMIEPDTQKKIAARRNIYLIRLSIRTNDMRQLIRRYSNDTMI